MDRHCEDISIGSKYTIRFDPATGKLKENKEVVIAGSVHVKPPNCSCTEAKLLRLEGQGERRYHPIWFVDCHECPFYRKPLPHDVATDRLMTDVGRPLKRS